MASQDKKRRYDGNSHGGIKHRRRHFPPPKLTVEDLNDFLKANGKREQLRRTLIRIKLEILFRKARVKEYLHPGGLAMQDKPQFINAGCTATQQVTDRNPVEQDLANCLQGKTCCNLCRRCAAIFLDVVDHALCNQTEVAVKTGKLPQLCSHHVRCRSGDCPRSNQLTTFRQSSLNEACKTCGDARCFESGNI